MSRILIVRNIQRNLLRTFLTVVGVSIGVTAIIGLLSISMGLRKSIDEQVNKLGQKMIMVLPGGGGFGPSVLIKNFGEREAKILSGIAGVERVTGRYVTSSTLEFKDKKISARIGGVNRDDLQYIVDLGFISFNQGSVFSDPKKVVLGKDIWKELDKPSIGQRVTINNERFEISGVLESVSLPGYGSVILMDLQKVWEIAGVQQDTYSLFMVMVTDPEVSKRIEQKFSQIYDKGEYSVMTNEKLVEQANQLLGIVNGFLIAITGVSLIVGVLGVANTMFVSITERIRQIGVMKTLGAKNTRIASIIIQEAALISMFGGIVGVITGLILGNAIAYLASFYEIQLTSFVPINMIIVTILGTIILGIISGFIPAWQASNLDPVEALKL